MFVLFMIYVYMNKMMVILQFLLSLTSLVSMDDDFEYDKVSLNHKV